MIGPDREEPGIPCKSSRNWAVFWLAIGLVIIYYSLGCKLITISCLFDLIIAEGNANILSSKHHLHLRN